MTYIDIVAHPCSPIINHFITNFIDLPFSFLFSNVKRSVTQSFGTNLPKYKVLQYVTLYAVNECALFNDKSVISSNTTRNCNNYGKRDCVTTSKFTNERMSALL